MLSVSLKNNIIILVIFNLNLTVSMENRTQNENKFIQSCFHSLSSIICDESVLMKKKNYFQQIIITK